MVVPSKLKPNVEITDEFSEDSDKEFRRYGVIETSIFKYLTPLMLIIAAVVLCIIGYNAGKLYVYFETNVALNGLIIFLLCLALGRVFYNNYELYQTAHFLKKVEHSIELGETSQQDVDLLHRQLRKKAHLMDTQNMQSAIQNIAKFGHLNFTDNDARLIKSKLGYRVRLRKADVGFVAGILVMLGLLGTFLGLLKTIDSVGVAMSSMSNLGSGGSIDENAMSDFVSSLSAPLQGMGLAFSSSLFGLSGSLLIGYFNHLGGGAQDKFIENVGRWIDDRIPTFKPLQDTKKKGNKPASKDDLQSWLAGYVYLSVKTNKRLGVLTHSLLETVRKLGNNEDVLKDIAANQTVLTKNIEGLTSSVNTTTQSAEKYLVRAQENMVATQNSLAAIASNQEQTGLILRGEVLNSVQNIKDILNSIDHKTHDSSHVLAQMGQKLDAHNNGSDKASVMIEGLTSVMKQQSDDLRKGMQDVAMLLQQSQTQQAQILNVIGQANNQMEQQSSPAAAKGENSDQGYIKMMEDMGRLMEDIDQNDELALKKLLGDDDAEDYLDDPDLDPDSKPEKDN